MSFRNKENRPFLGILISLLFSSVPKNPQLPTGEDADKGQLRELHQQSASTDITVVEYIASVLKKKTSNFIFTLFLHHNISYGKIYHEIQYA